MKKVFVLMVRIVSIICIILDIIGMSALFYMAQKLDLLGLVIQKWQENPLNFSDPDIATINKGILFLVIPIILLFTVKNKKEQQIK